MPVLTRGTRGDSVRRLQALLCLAGFDAKPIDGDFGPGTERAVRACQTGHGRPATGEADEKTQQAIGMDQPDSTRVAQPVIDRVDADIVAEMFSPANVRPNIDRHLPHVLAALRDADMDDRDLVLMALATIRAESEGFEPIDERVSKHNTDRGASPFNRYDNRDDLGNRGPPDGRATRDAGSCS